MIILLSIAALTCTALTGAAQDKPHIAVVPAADSRESAARVSTDLSTYVRTLLENELTRSGRFRLAERARVAVVLEELSFQQSGVTDAAGMAEIGHHLNVDKLFFVGVHRLYPNYRVTVKIVDVTTNEVLRVEEQDLGTKADQVKIPTLRLAQRLIDSALLLEPVEMVFFSAGQFRMGSTGGAPDEQPEHEVALSPFYLDKYEVSAVALRAYREATRLRVSPRKNPDHPATMVSWTEAYDFCSWLDKRLPTEAEWEYAAKGSEGRSYPWGEKPPTRSLARFGGLQKGPVAVHTTPAGATPQGVFHLAGNVAEWVQDWWQPGYYATSPLQDPQGPETGDYKIFRGGSWSDSAVEIRPTVRGFHNMSKGAGYIGFRCAKSGESGAAP